MMTRSVPVKQAVEGFSGAVHSCSKHSDATGSLPKLPKHSVYHGQGQKRLYHERTEVI